MRKVPEPLYQQVLEIALALTNATEAGNASARRGAYWRLRSLYRSRLGSPDSFLTETLADFTDAGIFWRCRLEAGVLKSRATSPSQPASHRFER